MKKKSTIWIVVILIAIVLLGVYFFGSGSDLQGRFGLSSPFTLSSSSPSGAKTVSSSDVIMEVDIERTVTAGSSFTLRLTADGDISADSDGLTVYLKKDGITVTTANLVYKSSDLATASFTLKDSLVMGGTYDLVINTATLLDEDAGRDDPLTPVLRSGFSSVRGATLNY